MVKTFLHCGDLGDIIYSLPFVRSMGGGKIYLDELGGYSHPLVKWADRKSTKLNLNSCHELLEVIEQQNYIKSWEIIKYDYKKQLFDYDLNTFRTSVGKKNLIDSYFIEKENYTYDWINIKDKIELDRPIIISRSVRYHSNFSFWESILPHIKDKCYFVGYEKEHDIFQYTFGHKIDRIETKTILDLAKVIAGAKQVISNANFTYALATAMGKQTIHEYYRIFPVTIFERPDAQYV